MEQLDGAQRRQYYRLKYPKKARPLMCIEDWFFQVSESSEKGIRLLMNNLAHLYYGFKLSGTVRLHDDHEVQVEGSILRFDQDEVIVKLEKGLSFRDMVAEQRHIRKKYPTFFASQARLAS